MKLTGKIEGLCCPNCAREIEEEIQGLNQLQDARLNFMTGRIEITVPENSPASVWERKLSQIIEAVEPDATLSPLQP